MIKTLTVDKYEIMALGESIVLKKVKGIKVVGSVTSHADALAVLHSKVVDVIVLELQLFDDTGTDLYQKVLADFPNTNILLHTEFSVWFQLYRVFREGVRGILSKRSNPDKMAEVVFGLMEGKTMIDNNLHLIPWIGKTIDGHKVSFTNTEIKVLQSLLLTNDWELVTSTLQMKPAVLNYHRSNLYKKLGAKNAEETLNAVGELQSAFIK